MAYTVNLLSRFYTRQAYVACQAALHILVSLDSTVEHGIVILNLTDEEPLRAYSDADWAGDLDISRSTTGYIVYMCGVHQWLGSRDYSQQWLHRLWRLNIWPPMQQFRRLCRYEG